MIKTGMVAIATPAGDVIRVELMTRDNFDSFVIDLLAEGRTLDISEDPEGNAIVAVKDGRRPFEFAYVPMACLYEPKFKLTSENYKFMLTQVPQGQKAKPW